jgi:accessory gene regulator B
MASKFIAMGVIKEEDRAIYDYSFQLLLSDALNITALVLLSFIIGKVFETMLYMISFIYLRSIAGGYHASSHLKCFLTMLFAYTAFLMTLFLLPLRYHLLVTIVSFILSIVIVFILAPVGHVNKPLNTKERLSLAKKSRLTIILSAIITISLQSLFIETWPGLSVGLSMFSVSVSMIAAYLGSREKGKRGEKE